MRKPDVNNIWFFCKVVTVKQVCAFTALTVRKRSGNRHKSICEANFAWICARNYEGTE